MKNRAVSRYRKLKNERAYVSYVDYSNIDLSRTECDSSQIDLIISVGQALKTLDETEKIIIQSTYFEGKTVRQIASELGLSKSSVARLKHESLEKLKIILCSDEGGEKNENE
jgi:RNA polymerase sigma factor (sigma-70 family)